MASGLIVIVDMLAGIGFNKRRQFEWVSSTGSVENDAGANLKFISGMIATRIG